MRRNLNKKSIKNLKEHFESSVERFKENYYKEIFKAKKILKKISKISWDEIPDKTLDRLNRTLSIYDSPVKSFIEQASGFETSDDIIDLCLEVNNRYGTDMQMPLYAIEEAGSILGIDEEELTEDVKMTSEQAVKNIDKLKQMSDKGVDVEVTDLVERAVKKVSNIKKLKEQLERLTRRKVIFRNN